MTPSRIPHQSLASWLKYFDVEFLDKDLCDQLAMLDLNDPEDRRKAIQVAVAPEFASLNGISQESMRRVLHAALAASESELQPVFSQIGMPFKSEVERRTKLIKTIWEELFSDAGA